MKGRVVRISATSITCSRDDGSRKWAASDVALITQRRGHAGRGALIGLAAGASSAGTLSSRTANARITTMRAVGEDAAAAWYIGGLLGRHWRWRRCSYRRCDQTGASPGRGADSVGTAFELRVAPGVIGLRAQLRF